MCEPLTDDLEKRHKDEPPPNGEEKRMNGNGTVPWRALVDWGVRLLLLIIVYFLNGQRTALDDLREDMTDVRIDVAAVVQANQTQSADILTNRETVIELMRLINEGTRNMATLTERVAALAHDVESLEGDIDEMQ
ncbi:MAG: hypothetical protein AMJ65_15520 [Phycisphaerae bacterium SG8_4]|nr:MAG: hypothetical protein AMJ65_15520 [Phycisphaerae bacterium SG8_4]